MRKTCLKTRASSLKTIEKSRVQSREKGIVHHRRDRVWNVRSVLAFCARRPDFFDVRLALVDFSPADFILEFRLFDDLIVLAYNRRTVSFFKINIQENCLLTHKKRKTCKFDEQSNTSKKTRHQIILDSKIDNARIL